LCLLLLLRLCSSSRFFDLSYVAYLNAKKAPITKPGIEIKSRSVDTANDINTPRTPEAMDTIMSIRNVDFVGTNLLNVENDGICRFLSKLKRNKKGSELSADACR